MGDEPTVATHILNIVKLIFPPKTVSGAWISYAHKDTEYDPQNPFQGTDGTSLKLENAVLGEKAIIRIKTEKIPVSIKTIHVKVIDKDLLFHEVLHGSIPVTRVKKDGKMTDIFETEIVLWNEQYQSAWNAWIGDMLFEGEEIELKFIVNVDYEIESKTYKIEEEIDEVLKVKKPYFEEGYWSVKDDKTKKITKAFIGETVGLFITSKGFAGKEIEIKFFEKDRWFNPDDSLDSVKALVSKDDEVFFKVDLIYDVNAPAISGDVINGIKLNLAKAEEEDKYNLYIKAIGDYNGEKIEKQLPESEGDYCAVLRVRIKAENGQDDPLVFIPKDKSIKYKVIPDLAAESITIKWKAAGKISVVGTDTNETVEIKGVTASANLNDVNLELECTVEGRIVPLSLPVTVVEFKELKAILKCTPRKNGDKIQNTIQQDKISVTDSDSLAAADITAGTTAVITLVKGCRDIELELIVEPADVAIAWEAKRAADDNAALTGIPTIKNNGPTDKKKILESNAEGSFHISAFIDHNKNGKRDAEDFGLIFNINMIKIQVMPGVASNRIYSNNHFNNSRSNANYLVVDSQPAGVGGVPATGSIYTDIEFNNRAIGIKMTVKVIGGGPDQRRGVDKVTIGYIHTTTSDSIRGTYADGRTVEEKIYPNPPPVNNPYIGPVITTLSFPVRDHRGNSASGSNTFLNSSSDADKSNIPAGGEKKIVRVLDSPAIVIPLKHPVTNSLLAGISGSNDFDFFLSAYSDNFDENFTIIATASWNLTYGTYTAAAGWTNAGASVNAPAAMTVLGNSTPGKDTNVERCPPGFTDNLRLYAGVP